MQRNRSILTIIKHLLVFENIAVWGYEYHGTLVPFSVKPRMSIKAHLCMLTSSCQGTVSATHVPFPSRLWCWESRISLDQVTHQMRYWKTDSHPLIPCFHFTIKDPYLHQGRAGVLPSAHTAEIALALMGVCQLSPLVNLTYANIFAQTCWFCTQYQMKFETFQKSYKWKNISVWSTLLFSFLSLSSSDIAKLCSNLVGIGETKQKNDWRAFGKLEFLWGKDLCCEAVRNPKAFSQCLHFAIKGAMSFLWSRLYLDGQSTKGWRKSLRMTTWVLCPAYSQKMPWQSSELLLFCLTAMKTREMLLVRQQLNQRTGIVLAKSSLWSFLVLDTICPFSFLSGRFSDRSTNLWMLCNK